MQAVEKVENPDGIRLRILLQPKASRDQIVGFGSNTIKTAHLCRFPYLFNRALAWQNEQYEQDNSVKFSYTKIANLLPHWKKEQLWLKGCYSQVLQQSLKDLESAFKNFFQKRFDFQKFKKKGLKLSFSASLQTGTTK